jgi:hypothetical protein
MAERLEDLKRPVGARGILLLRSLLEDAGSPLYDRESAEALPFYVDAALEGLEGR